jgi:hypothetical protein
LNIILAGGINESKYEKISAELIADLKAKGIAASTTYVNTYTHQDLSSFEENSDVVVAIGTNKLSTSLPVVEGMGLLYAWMGKDSVVEKIEQYNK